MSKLTDEELIQLELAGETAAEDCAEYTTKRGTPTYDDARIGRMMARDPWVARAADAVNELRELRALLSTPLPCGFDTPRFVRRVGHGGIDGVEWNPFGTRGGGIAYEPDEAIALGAALIRAAQSALAGKGDSK